MTVGRSKAKTHQIGATYEDKAVAYLKAQGLKLLVQNWHVAQVGELDIVMLDDNKEVVELVFIEVKRRASKAFGGAIASVTPAKQAKITSTASVFLSEHPKYTKYPCRFDVVVFETEKPHWLKAAFM